MTFGLIKGLVRHTHWHDGIAGPEKLKIVPFGKGTIPLDDMMRRLIALGYNGISAGRSSRGITILRRRCRSGCSAMRRWG